MKYTKIEKLNMVKEIVANATMENVELQHELVEMVGNEIESTSNKYATAKLKKESKKNAEYAELEPKVLAFFEGNKNLQIGNSNIDLDISTSKKTVILKRLIEKGIVKRIAPKGKQKTVLYQLV